MRGRFIVAFSQLLIEAGWSQGRERHRPSQSHKAASSQSPGTIYTRNCNPDGVHPRCWYSETRGERFSWNNGSEPEGTRFSQNYITPHRGMDKNAPTAGGREPVNRQLEARAEDADETVAPAPGKNPVFGQLNRTPRPSDRVPAIRIASRHLGSRSQKGFRSWCRDVAKRRLGLDLGELNRRFHGHQVRIRSGGSEREQEGSRPVLNAQRLVPSSSSECRNIDDRAER